MEPTVHHYVRNIFLTIFSFGVVALIGYLGYQNYFLRQSETILKAELLSAKQDATFTAQTLAENIDALKQLLVATNSDKANAEDDARRQQEMVESMNAQLDGMEESLGLYKKLATTDRELLTKYSRVYFLSENYSPQYSATIPPSYLSDPAKETMMLREVWPFLQAMLADANAQAVDLKIISAYRSFDTQTKIKNAYTVAYGSGSNKFSADQGYSEHQLGTAIDFTTSKLGAQFTTFEKTPSYVWLTDNAYKYGFVLSYPKGNAYYIFEPWHWRFVGKALALRLHNEGKNFVDLPQRDINEYLVSLFDGMPVVK